MCVCVCVRARAFVHVNIALRYDLDFKLVTGRVRSECTHDLNRLSKSNRPLLAARTTGTALTDNTRQNQSRRSPAASSAGSGQHSRAALTTIVRSSEITVCVCVCVVAVGDRVLFCVSDAARRPRLSCCRCCCCCCRRRPRRPDRWWCCCCCCPPSNCGHSRNPQVVLATQ